MPVAPSASMTTASSFALAAPSRPVASTNEPERSTSSCRSPRGSATQSGPALRPSVSSARDRYLILADDPLADGTTEDRIQLILDGLSKPLVGVVDGTASTGSRMSSTSAKVRLRLRILGDRIGSGKA